MLNEVKSRFAGKQKLLYIVIIIIALSAHFILFRLIQSGNPKEETKTETTYSPGKTEMTYKQGKASVTTKTKSLHKKIILHHSAEDSTYKYSVTDSSYKLSLNLKPDSTGNISLDYFLDLTTKDLVRIDTIFQTRIDTLKIKQTITEIIGPPFYNTFLFGAATTAVIIILILHFIP